MEFLFSIRGLLSFSWSRSGCLESSVIEQSERSIVEEEVLERSSEGKESYSRVEAKDSGCSVCWEAVSSGERSKRGERGAAGGDEDLVMM